MRSQGTEIDISKVAPGNMARTRAGLPNCPICWGCVNAVYCGLFLCECCNNEDAAYCECCILWLLFAKLTEVSLWKAEACPDLNHRSGTCRFLSYAQPGCSIHLTKPKPSQDTCAVEQVEAHFLLCRCTHALHHLAKGTRMLGSYFGHETGNSPSWLFR